MCIVDPLTCAKQNLICIFTLISTPPYSHTIFHFIFHHPNRCNICGMQNDVPSTYFSHLDNNGQRRDRDQRPELSRSSVEFVAPGDYMVCSFLKCSFYSAGCCFFLRVSATHRDDSVRRRVNHFAHFNNLKLRAHLFTDLSFFFLLTTHRCVLPSLLFTSS